MAGEAPGGKPTEAETGKERIWLWELTEHSQRREAAVPMSWGRNALGRGEGLELRLVLVAGESGG